MAGTSTSALPNGGSAVLTFTAAKASFTVSYLCSNPADAAANIWVEGSVDGGTTFFPLNPSTSSVPSQSATGSGARSYTGQAVNAIRVNVRCTGANTVTATVDGE